MVIEFPSKSWEVATLADVLTAIERPWNGEMHVRAIGIHVARMRLAVQTLSDLLDQSPATISSDWLLSLTATSIKDMASRVAAPYRRGFVRASLELIQHTQFYRDNELKRTEQFTAGLKYQ